MEEIKELEAWRRDALRVRLIFGGIVAGLLVQEAYGPRSFSLCQMRSEMIRVQSHRNRDGTYSPRASVFDGIVFRIKQESPVLWLQMFPQEGLFCPMLGRKAPCRMKSGNRTSDREAAQAVRTEAWMEDLPALSWEVRRLLAVTLHDRSLCAAVQGPGDLRLRTSVARQTAWAKGEAE